MAGQSFAAQVSELATQEEERLEAIFQRSAEAVFNEMTEPGGRVPRVTGNLARSVVASVNSMPPIRPEKVEYPDTMQESIGTILGAELGSTVWIGFQAAYSARVNYGFVGTDSLGRLYNQIGRGFIEAAQQRWPQIVAEAEAKVRSRHEAGSPPA